jgi:osmotically-inducible protein OsmY
MVDARDIEVRVQNGVVMLSGTVNSRQTKRMSEDIAASIPGVQDVENRIRISSAHWSDAAERG